MINLKLNMTPEQKLIQSIDAELVLDDVQIDNFRIHYVTAGSGPPLLLIHGANIGWGQWYPNIAELAKHFKVYALDLPGSGYSTSIDFRKSDPEKCFVEVVYKFIKIKNLGHINIIGHSIGGWITIKLALKEKEIVDRIVLVNPLGFSRYVPWRYRPMSIYLFAKIISKTAMRPSRKKMEEFLISVLENSSPLAEKFVDYFYENVKNSKLSHPLLFVNSTLRYFRMKEELLLLKDLSKINHSTLIISGSDDPLIPFNKTFKAFGLIPNARVEIFLNTGHVPSIEKSEKFNALVIDYLISSKLRY